jgi:hypothetical protein
MFFWLKAWFYWFSGYDFYDLYINSPNEMKYNDKFIKFILKRCQRKKLVNILPLLPFFIMNDKDIISLVIEKIKEMISSNSEYFPSILSIFELPRNFKLENRFVVFLIENTNPVTIELSNLYNDLPESIKSDKKIFKLLLEKYKPSNELSELYNKLPEELQTDHEIFDELIGKFIHKKWSEMIYDGMETSYTSHGWYSYHGSDGTMCEDFSREDYPVYHYEEREEYDSSLVKKIINLNITSANTKKIFMEHLRLFYPNIITKLE